MTTTTPGDIVRQADRMIAIAAPVGEAEHTMSAHAIEPSQWVTGKTRP
jgi:hypothetical protein